MKIACAFDHAGFPLKAMVLETVAAEGHEVIDLGTWSTDPVDYPDTARLAAEAVRGDADRAVLVCGSGAGVAVAACKFPDIRAVVAHDTYTAHQSVEHDDCNILCLGGRVIGPALAARHHPRLPGRGVHRRGPPQAAAGEDRRHRARVPAGRHLGRMRLCVRSNATSAASRSRRPTTKSWSARLTDHLAEEHDETPDEDEVQQTIDREAYDAVDS